MAFQISARRSQPFARGLKSSSFPATTFTASPASDKDDAGGNAPALPANSIVGRKQSGRQRGSDGYHDD